MTTLKELFALFQLNAATDDITKAAPETWDNEMDKMRVTEQLQAQLQAQAKQAAVGRGRFAGDDGGRA